VTKSEPRTPAKPTKKRAKAAPEQPVRTPRRAPVSKKKAALYGKQPTPDQRTAFANGLADWLRQEQFHIGSNLGVTDPEEGLGAAKIVAALLENFVPDSLDVSAGAGSEELLKALTPFFPLADMVASKVAGRCAIVPLMIFADDLSVSSLLERLKQFVTLGTPLNQFGLRSAGKSGGIAELFPLLIYFDSNKYTTARDAMVPEGWQTNAWQRVYLRTGFTDVSEGIVTWVKKAGFINSVLNSLGITTTHFNFQSSDLQTVHTVAHHMSKQRAPQQ
jgi:hypothetical protein